MPEKHFCVTALTFLKKIFYMKSFDHFAVVSNEDARRMFDSDKDGFLQKVSESVADSLSHVYDEQPQECPIHFTDAKPAHDLIRESILGKPNASTDGAAPLFGTTETKGTDNDGFYDVTNEVINSQLVFSRLQRTLFSFRYCMVEHRRYRYFSNKRSKCFSSEQLALLQFQAKLIHITLHLI
jgi:hypothetical protein